MELLRSRDDQYPLLLELKDRGRNSRTRWKRPCKSSTRLEEQ